MKDLQSFVEAVQYASSKEAAFAEFKNAIDHYGYNNAVYSLMTDHPSIGEAAFHGISTDYPDDWMNYYSEHNLHHIDPVFQRILQRSGAFFWSEAEAALQTEPFVSTEQRSRAQAMMREAADAGLASGIGVSIVNRYGEIAGVGISRPECGTGQDIQVLADLSLLATVFHEKFISDYEEQKPPSLSGREKEVLLWSASGKSDWEIATILGVSRATIRFHWNNIFRKFAVNNKTVATLLAVRRKLIFPDTLKPTSEHQIRSNSKSD